MKTNDWKAKVFSSLFPIFITKYTHEDDEDQKPSSTSHPPTQIRQRQHHGKIQKSVEQT